MPAFEDPTDDAGHTHRQDTDIHLRFENWSARISPVGASIRDLSFEQHKIIEGSWPDADKWFAGSTLAPWVNRLADGTWTDQAGAKHEAPINDEKNHCANHGLVFNRAFRVENLSESAVELAATCFDPIAYPYEVVIRVSFALGPNGLSVSMQVENLGTEPAPVAYGSHPYLVVDQDSRLVVQAETQILVDEHMIPIGTSPLEARVYAIEPAQRADFTDTCFTDLTAVGGFVTTKLTRPSMHRTIELSQTPDFAFIQVFTLQAGFAGHPGLLALEPQTAAANVLNTGENLITLQPGGSRISQWTLGLGDSIHA